MFNIKRNNFLKLSKSFFFFLLTAIVLFSSLAFGTEEGDLMKAGNDYYQRKQYEKAIDTYKKVIQMGYEGVSLYYNLGDAYYREGKIGYAILYFEKAHRLAPGDDDVNHNLAIANTRTVDKINTMPKFFLFQWWESLLALFSLTGWIYLAYVFYIALLLSIGFYFFAKRPGFQRYSFFGGLSSLVLLIITASLLLVKLNRELNVKSAIIIEPTVTVKQGPDPTNNDAFVIHEGLKVREEDHVNNWVKIRLQDGKEGWMLQKDLRTI
jgi:tetratricopeptide (TPR) repeat protein